MPRSIPELPRNILGLRPKTKNPFSSSGNRFVPSTSFKEEKKSKEEEEEEEEGEDAVPFTVIRVSSSVSQVRKHSLFSSFFNKSLTAFKVRQQGFNATEDGGGGSDNSTTAATSSSSSSSSNSRVKGRFPPRGKINNNSKKPPFLRPLAKFPDIKIPGLTRARPVTTTPRPRKLLRLSTPDRSTATTSAPVSSAATSSPRRHSRPTAFPRFALVFFLTKLVRDSVVCKMLKH